jgi:3-hydroxyacyl-[acyl-carrier-protein] dehydratase
MVESLAQLGGFAVLLDQRYAGKLPLFGGIERARFRRQVVPGDTLELG